MTSMSTAAYIGLGLHVHEFPLTRLPWLPFLKEQMIPSGFSSASLLRFLRHVFSTPACWWVARWSDFFCQRPHTEGGSSQ